MGEFEDIGLFVASYEISTGMAGAPTMHATLVVSTPERTVHGTCTVTQAVNPPLRFAAELTGTFDYLGLMPPSPTNVIVHAIGYPVGTLPNTPIAPTARLDMLLDPSWSDGVANFRYNGVQIDGAKVTLVPPRAVSELPPKEISLVEPSKAGRRPRARAGAK